MSLLDKGRYKTFVGTLHCTLENGADLYVNERQKIRHYRAFFTSRGAYVKLRYIAMLYTQSIGN